MAALQRHLPHVSKSSLMCLSVSLTVSITPICANLSSFRTLLSHPPHSFATPSHIFTNHYKFIASKKKEKCCKCFLGFTPPFGDKCKHVVKCSCAFCLSFSLDTLKKDQSNSMRKLPSIAYSDRADEYGFMSKIGG